MSSTTSKTKSGAKALGSLKETITEFGEGKLWFSQGRGAVTVGVTDAAIEELGEIESVVMPLEGEFYEEGDVVVTLEGTQGSLEVIAPVSGTVQDINAGVQDEPGTISEDPLEEGWLVKLSDASGSDESEDSDEDSDEDEDFEDEDFDEDEDLDEDFDDDEDGEDEEDGDEEESEDEGRY